MQQTYIRATETDIRETWHRARTGAASRAAVINRVSPAPAISTGELLERAHTLGWVEGSQYGLRLGRLAGLAIGLPAGCLIAALALYLGIRWGGLQ